MSWSRRVGISAALATVALGVVCLSNGLRRVSRPFPGFLVAQNRIVVSVARSNWPLARTARVAFSEIVAVNGRSVSDPREIDALLAAVPAGGAVAYRFRKGASVFTENMPVGRFTFADWLAIYASYCAVGLVFVGGGLWAFLRLRGPAALAFFVLCLAIGTVLCTGGDVYGPYWFTRVYFLAHALTPAALLHLAASYPEAVGGSSRWRRVILVGLYGGCTAIGGLLNVFLHEPWLFLPLVYTVYLLLANALLLYTARLAANYWGIADAAVRKGLACALVGVLGSGTLAGTIFVVYPALEWAISPLVLVVPLALFPLLTAAALARRRIGEAGASTMSVRSRLVLLFLGMVESMFLAGVGVFWLNESWQHLIDDLTLNRNQQVRVEHFLADPPTAAAEVDAVLAAARTADEQWLVAEWRAALARGDRVAAEAFVAQLSERYRAMEARLSARRSWLVRVSLVLVGAVMVGGVLQAIGFVVAVRRWLIRPIERLATATAVLATGDLRHRIALTPADEFASLAGSINAMAASLHEIQQRMHAERDARQEAAGAARDAERRRVARELHDGALQNLSAIKFGLESAIKHPGSTSLSDILDGTMQCLSELRAVVDDLRAPVLLHASLPEAIGEQARAMGRTHEVDLQLELEPAVRVAPWASQDVYRIAQEAIANAIRHGNPRHLTVRLREESTAVILEVQDDGRGFDLARVRQGSGLAGMRERAAALGADLQITSDPGCGTRLRLAVPRSRATSPA